MNSPELVPLTEEDAEQVKAFQEELKVIFNKYKFAMLPILTMIGAEMKHEIHFYKVVNDSNRFNPFGIQKNIIKKI